MQFKKESISRPARRAWRREFAPCQNHGCYCASGNLLSSHRLHLASEPIISRPVQLSGFAMILKCFFCETSYSVSH